MKKNEKKKQLRKHKMIQVKNKRHLFETQNERKKIEHGKSYNYSLELNKKRLGAPHSRFKKIGVFGKNQLLEVDMDGVSLEKR